MVRQLPLEGLTSLIPLAAEADTFVAAAHSLEGQRGGVLHSSRTLRVSVRTGGEPYQTTARRSASRASTAGALFQKPHGRMIVTVLLPASLPVVSLTKTLNEATSPGLSRPVVVLRLSVSDGTVATTVAVAAS